MVFVTQFKMERRRNLIFYLINNLIGSAFICKPQMPVSHNMQYINSLSGFTITTLITEYDFCNCTSVITSGDD